MKNLKYLLTAMTLLVFAVTPLTLSAGKKDDEAGQCTSEQKYCDLGIGLPNNTVHNADEAKALEHSAPAMALRVGTSSSSSHAVQTAAADEIGRPESPYIEIDAERIDGYQHVDDDDTKRAIKALGLESRLKLHDPLSKRIRIALRQRPQPETYAGALVYDDGTTDGTMFSTSFSNYFTYMEEHDRAALANHYNPYDCEYGNHATAVTATLQQACPATRYPITVVGGDGKKGHFSDGPMIDDTWVPQLMKDLKRDDIRHNKLHNPVVFNASYGYDARGDFGDTLDEGGVWRTFWDEVAGSVVVQAAGNESTNLTASDRTISAENAYETTHNMLYTFDNPEYRGRLIHAMASIPDFDSGENIFAASFSNYYKKLDTVSMHAARDYSLMAPGEYIFVPMDPFDADGDRKFHVDADQLNEWSGTSAASPMVSGAILRLVNEFGITAKEAAAILLETADHVYERKAKGELKSMNLGAALLEGVRREIYAEIAKPTNNYRVFSKYFLNTYFGDRKGTLTVAERNFIFDIADRCGHVYVMKNDRKTKYRRLKNWRKKYVRRGKYQSEELYYKRARNGVLSAYCFVDPEYGYLKTIETQESGEDRVADFVLTYNKPVAAPSVDEFKVKGVLDTDIEIFEVEGSGKDYIISVRVPDNFTSERVLSLHVNDALILGKQDNRATFDGSKFVIGE